MIVNPASSQHEGFSIGDPTGTKSVVLQGKAASWVKTLSEDEEECGTNWKGASWVKTLLRDHYFVCHSPLSVDEEECVTNWILTCATQAQDLCRKIIFTDASAKQHDRVRRRRPRRVRRSRHTGVVLL